MGIALFALIFFLDLQLSLFENLCLVLGILLSIISLLNYSYYMFKKEESIQKET